MEGMGRATLLIVDDALESIAILNQILGAEYRVLFAEDGLSGLELARRKQPDLILLDISMPGMDGLELCHRLKGDPTTHSIPVIFVTAKDQEQDQERGLRCGAADYITKPVSPTLVKARVATQLRLRRSEEAQRRAQKLAAVGQLTGGIAHEFNNILGIMLGNLEFLEPLVAHEQSALRRVRSTTRAALRMSRLVEQLRDFSRLRPIHSQVIDLNAVITEMYDLLLGSVGDEVELVLQLAPALWPIKADRGELEESLWQLVNNACEAMPKGGRIQIETANRVVETFDPTIKSGEYLRLAVSDSGCGMEREVLERLFEPFFSTKKPFGSGCGLGMSRIYGFVQRCGGTIRVYSEPKMGSCLQLYLPRADGSLESPQ